ncbi:MAG: acetylglutamate kinase [Parachlamydiaceae bacterium]
MKNGQHEIIVIKYGGAAMQSPEFMQEVLEDIAHLKKQGNSVIVVHGGGVEISSHLKRLQINPRFIEGLRVTDRETMEVVQMVLIGKVNKELVAGLNAQQAKAVGISGIDAELLMAEKYPSTIDYGFVGNITHVNIEFLETLLAHDFLPVVAPIAISKAFQTYNINADSAAAAIAVACQAKHLVFLTDVPGILRDVKDPSSKIDRISHREVEQMIATGALSGGILPKLEGALSAASQGVSNVHILDGRVSHCLKRHFNGSEQIGTLISG